MSDKKPEPRKRTPITRTAAVKPAAAKPEDAVPTPSKASLRKQRNKSIRASLPKEGPAAKSEPGHPHRCNDCMSWYRHDDPKCPSLGMAWRLCPDCTPPVLLDHAPLFPDVVGMEEAFLTSPPLPEPPEGIDALDAEHDALLNRMQTPEAREAMKAAFDAPPGLSVGSELEPEEE